MRTFAAALLLAILLSGAAAPPPAGGPVERIPNADPNNFYPRWLSWTAPMIGIRTTPPIQISHEKNTSLAIAVDSRNVVHAVNRNSTPNPLVGNTLEPYFYSGTEVYSQIDYKSDRFESRQWNGFSAEERLDDTTATITDSSIPDEDVGAPDIAVGANDDIHVVWVHHFCRWVEVITPKKSIVHKEKWHVYYRKKTAAGWSATANLTPNAIDETMYYDPRIKVGRDGLVRIVAGFYNPNVPDNPDGTPGMPYNLMYITFGNGSPESAFITPVQEQGIKYGISDPRIEVDAANSTHLVWTETYRAGTTNPAIYFNEVYYARAFISGFAQKMNFADTFDPYKESNSAPNLAVDATGRLHLVWIHTNRDTGISQLYHKDDDSFPAALNGPVPTPALGSGAVLVDSRGQAHVLWKEAGALIHAARVKNPGPDLSATWRFQRPAVPAPSADITYDQRLRSAAISKTDQIHLAGDNYYTRTMEYGLGVRDAAAMVGAFPGASVNTTSGNLLYSLGIYSTSGFGPCQSASLVYNSLDQDSSMFGAGWRLNYDSQLIDHSLAFGNSQDDRITVIRGDGRAIEFQYDADLGCLVAKDESGYSAKIVRTTAGNTIKPYRLTDKNGTVLTFDANGKLVTITDATGNSLWLGYENSDPAKVNWTRLRQIGDMLGNGTEAPNGRWTGYMEYETRTSALVSPRPVSFNGPVYTEFEYTDNHLTRVSFPYGPGAPAHKFEYDDAGLIHRFLPPRGAADGYGWTCTYLPDRRLSKVEDPEETFLLDSEGDSAGGSSRTASMKLVYDETVPPTEMRKTWVKDRRGADTLFEVEPRRGLVWKIHDPDALAGTPGILPTIRIFDEYGNLTNVQDRRGLLTSTSYHETAVPACVHDNVKEVRRPKADGTGQELVASFTYTTDGFNNVDTATAYATPAGGSGPVAVTTDYDYDSYGRLTQVKHPNVTRPDGTAQTNVTTQYEYHGSRGQLTRIVDEEGHATAFYFFHALHGLPQYELRDGGDQGRYTTYLDTGEVSAVYEPPGVYGNDYPGPTAIVRDALYRITSVQDPAGKITTYDYDIDSNLVKVMPPVGAVSTFTFDRRGFATGGTTPDGTWSQVVDAAGNVRRTTDFRGYASHFKFDALGRLAESRTPGGSTIVDGGGGPAFHVTQFVHDGTDGTGCFTSVTQVGYPADRTTKTILDGRGRPRIVLEPDGATYTETFYDEQDQPVARQLVYGTDVQTCQVFFRDARGRVDHVRVQDRSYGSSPSSNQSNTYTLYNKTGDVVRTVDPLGNVADHGYAHKVTYELDVRGRVEFVRDGKGTIVRRNFWGDDDLLAVVLVPDPRSKGEDLVPAARFAYTARKEIKWRTDGAGVGVSYVYGDLPGQVLTVTDPLSRITRTTYEFLTQRPHEVVEAEGTSAENRTSFAWTHGLMTEMTGWNPATRANDAVYRMFYDQAGRLERLEAPDSLPQRTFYNSFSEPERLVEGGKTETVSYDPMGRPFESSWSGAFSGTLTRGYNGAGMIESVSDGSRERRMAYDVWKGAPRDESLVVGGGTWKTVSHQTDDAGNLTGMVDPEAVTHGWPVDENNRILEKRYGSDAVVSFTYTPGGLPDQAFIKDATGVIVATTTHYYDGLGRKVRSQTVKAGTGEVLADYVWEYNPAGEIVKEAPWHLGAVFEDGRDARGRLTFQATPGNNGGSTPPPFENTIVGMPEGNQADPSLEAQGTPKKVLPVPARIAGYTLDPLGNRTFMQVDGVGTTLTYDAASRLISEISANGKSVTHEYDDWGQEIRKIASQDGFATATEAYGYDYLGRMSAYTNSSTGAAWQYDYWPNGDRYAKTNLSTQWKELYVPILGQVVADYTQTGSGEIRHENTYAEGEGSKAARISSGGARAHYVVGLGGSFDLTLGDEGAVLGEAVRDAFGVDMGGDSIGPYGYAQMRSDSESGLWTSANGGLYDASTGRVFDSAEDYGDWIDTQERVTGYRRIAWLQGKLREAESDWAAQFVYNATGGLVDAGLISLRWELAKEKGNQERVRAGCQDVMSGWSGMVFRGAGEISFANPIARILTGRSVTDPEVRVEAVDRWNEAALALVTFGLMRWSNALRAEMSAPRAISLEVEGAAQLARHERALAMHARAHTAARAEMRVAAQAERYVSPGMFRGEAARVQAESAARHGFTDATKSMVGMRGDPPAMTVRHYTDTMTRDLINKTGTLRSETYVTLPSEIPSRAGHIQIEKALEIRPGRGTHYIDVRVPVSQLRVPINGPITSGRAWQRQLTQPIHIDPTMWRRPPGRPLTGE